jgi:hypothetical protein
MASSMTVEQVRAWIKELEASYQKDLEEMSRLGPNPEWSISVSLSMFEAVRASGISLQDLHSEEEDEQVRKTWEKLQKAFGVGPGF